MTPELHHKGDTRWLTEQFDTLQRLGGFNYASSLAVKYSTTYSEIWHATEPPHKRDGVARAECNKRLRAAIRNLQNKFSAPPTI